MNSARIQMPKFNNLESVGYLEIIIGPMFSGKTSKLLSLYKQYKFCNIPIAVINHSADTRYHESMLSSHDKEMIPCIQTDKLENITTNESVDNSEVILINEAQFFPDLYNFVVNMTFIKNIRGK